MNAIKKLAVSLIFLIAASLFSISALIKIKTPANANNPQAARLVLFYGSACPHCKIVEDYIAQNRLSEKMDIAQKEVYQNQTNKNEFLGIAKICGLDLNNLGVPLLWDAKDSKCYSGDQPIIDFLKKQ